MPRGTYTNPDALRDIAEGRHPRGYHQAMYCLKAGWVERRRAPMGGGRTWIYSVTADGRAELERRR